MCMHVYMCARVCICVCVHTCVCVYMCVHTHVQMCPLLLIICKCQVRGLTLSLLCVPCSSSGSAIKWDKLSACDCQRLSTRCALAAL